MKKENATPDFVALEKQMLKFWEDNKCFEKLVEQNKNNEPFRFLDGPITANNPMGVHHAWGRTLKDVNIRYHAMHGKSCQYRNGFDSQGLWVEVETEKEAGIKDKRGIEEYGLDKFTEACMQRVKHFSDIITKQSKRLGQWMDWDNSYYTNTDLNITSIWYFLKKCHQKGYLVKSHRPMPWCPRCGTSLSEHEMAGSYKDIVHTSIYAKLPIKDSNDSILVWTTTPWTLSSNVALAVNSEIDYVRVKVKSDSRTLIVGKNALGKLKGDIVTVLDEFKGAELIGKEYTTVFSDLDSQKFVHTIVHWEEVDANEGTGVVHIAPGCGAGDFDLGKSLCLPTICPIDDSGIILEGFGPLSGKNTDEVTEIVVAEMQKNGTLYKTEDIEHSYPHCWRCKTSVVFKLVDEWSIATDELRPQLIAASNTVKYEPEHAGKRMNDWLTNMGDWNISRKRFYGLPLPFYDCKQCGELTVIGSKEELLELSENGSLEDVPHLHRPYIDKVKIRCPKCGNLVQRVPEVGDCWLDAGIAPFSTKGYFTDREYFDKNFPSDMVLEMKEQIRLWFYSMLFMSVVLTGKAPWKNAVVHSSVVQETGEKFSKTGHMIRFDEAADKMGVDAIRYIFGGAPINNDVRFGFTLADEARRKILSFWNIYIFFNLYASLDKPDLDNFKPNYDTFTHSDKWLIERTNQFIKKADQGYKNYNTAATIKEFESFTDDVSNWYIRINRKRFWKSENKLDQMNAYWCLYQAIKAAIKVMAPIIPFITDYIYQNTVRALEKDAKISVHLSDFAKEIDMPKNEKVLAETAIAREVIATCQRMRNEVQIKIKQPLSQLYVVTSKEKQDNLVPLLDIVKEELNIKEIVFAQNEDAFNEKYFTVNFRNAGAVLKKDAQKLKPLVDALENKELEKFYEQYKTGKVTIGNFVDLDSSLFDIHDRPKSGFAVAKENNFTLALDTHITLELKKEGFIRETIRQIQVLRKEAGFAVEQRIVASFDNASNEVLSALNEYKERIKQDILAVSIENDLDTGIVKEIKVNDETFTIKLKLA
ncbi:MAG: isoleucine--tRNA ligase [Clostridiales bacterium]|nr:isoleucine--tRNA ligase [Clostridiales bacterium]